MVDSLGSRAENLKQLLKGFNDQHSSSLTQATPVAAAGSAVVATETRRTQSRPVFTHPEAPPNFASNVTAKAEIPLLEFTNRHESLARHSLISF